MNLGYRSMHVTVTALSALISLSLAGAPMAAAPTVAKSKTEAIPEHYSKIRFPDFTYNPPYPKDYRVTLDRGVIAYLVPDTPLALIQMTVLFGHPNLAAKPA